MAAHCRARCEGVSCRTGGQSLSETLDQEGGCMRIGGGLVTLIVIILLLIWIF